jgi:hypothetical protein
MTLYLWHMLPVLIVAGAFYLTGLAPEPAYGSGSWWVLRVPWLVVLGVVLVGVVAALRPLERGLVVVYERTRPGDLPFELPRWPWALWGGMAASVSALIWFAGHGFAYGGRFPVLPAVGLVMGVGLVMVTGRSAVERGVRLSV